MIEIRNLNKYEFETLMSQAPESETHFIIQKDKPFEFFNSGGDTYGLIIDSRPIYIVMIRKGILDRWVFWTVVNSNVKDIITLSKYSKRMLRDILKKYKCIYATIEKVNKKNIQWVKWLGFEVCEEDNQYITFKLGA